MTREDLIELIARAAARGIGDDYDVLPERGGLMSRAQYDDAAEQVLRALSGAGLAVVPAGLSPEMEATWRENGMSSIPSIYDCVIDVGDLLRLRNKLATWR